ncbi:uncharacterized protein PFL1_00713 [Pseudozyma flocculosa PF-1]|uniref:ESCRT-II complex subunit VPS25 n=1 Tax=Pseudozyma flocculosa TaxID=84751 RepID=A0A5C3F3C9_9BASI|nr:uncharacterized protein PFL1_00713 [Pseudozyma flocculosa PF-1]EPQ31378.1 hypothetical protein PFL1_00713 [Pseudozyma flocculosa PF-1]SPO38842.1 related to VPS25 - vacuolar protein sorting [Pseudozyma flocculosa]
MATVSVPPSPTAAGHLGSSMASTATPLSNDSGGGAASASASGFSFPAIHSFPPFYTLQPNPTSRAQQLAQWRSLILAFCRHHRIFYVDAAPTSSSSSASAVAPGVDADARERDVWQSLFRNARISRALDGETVREILQDMVRNRQAAWDGVRPGKAATGTKALIYWRTPAQWADLIYDWVSATGQNKSIMTLFELTQGDLVEGQEFHNLPIPLLRQALQHLSTQGKAQIFAGTETDDGEGVKFV